jgi:hypothetical protein
MLYKIYWGWDAFCDQGSFLVDHNEEVSFSECVDSYMSTHAPEGAQMVAWYQDDPKPTVRCQCPDGGDLSPFGDCTYCGRPIPV